MLVEPLKVCFLLWIDRFSKVWRWQVGWSALGRCRFQSRSRWKEVACDVGAMVRWVLERYAVDQVWLCGIEGLVCVRKSRVTMSVTAAGW